MQKYNPVLIAGLVAGLAISCKKVDFGTTNNNPDPNAFLVANTQELLTNAQTYTWGDFTIASTGTVKEPMLYIQYLSQSQYPDAGLYNNTQPSWANWYAVALEDLKKIIEANTTKSSGAEGNGSAANQIAVARIYKAYLFSILTDRYGDIPYSQALQAPANLNPAYDKQQAIYTDLFKELREAAAQFDGGAAVKGDVIFDGNAAKWKKFANSLRMILALRLSKVAPTTGKAEFTAAYNDAAGYIGTNADNAVFNYLNNTTYRSPWNSLYNQRSDYGVSTTLVNILQSYGDPRISSFAYPISTNTYKGVPPGLSSANLQAWINANPNYSRMGSKITGWTWSGSAATLQSYKGTNNGYIITAAQMLLTKAEAELLGWIGAPADATADYTNAIKTSWDQWNVAYTAADLTTYLAGANVAPSTTTATMLSRIGYQKWLALYPNGQEAWSEWRRTGYPALTPAPDAVSTSPAIPRRLTYPATEITLNAANYAAQVSTMPGGDAQSTRVWWDKQ